MLLEANILHSNTQIPNLAHHQNPAMTRHKLRIPRCKTMTCHETEFHSYNTNLTVNELIPNSNSINFLRAPSYCSPKDNLSTKLKISICCQSFFHLKYPQLQNTHWLYQGLQVEVKLVQILDTNSLLDEVVRHETHYAICS